MAKQQSNGASERAHVLVIDDDEYLRRFIARGLSRTGMAARPIEGGHEAIDLLGKESFDAVVCDLHMPEKDGLDVLKVASAMRPPPPFIMLTGYGSVSVAVEAMKRGAADFLEKPVSIDELQAAIQAAIRQRQPIRPLASDSRLVGSAQWLEPFLQTLHRVAQSNATVLIEGETGTGKSAVAREICRASKRADGPFVELNCAAIPESLLENELFGHVRGAYTGAVGQSGRVEQANGGTLFLDEAGELKPELQAKLLHLIQERSYAPVGGSTFHKADVRFLAATNRDLESEVKEGRFREDLYFRLNVVSLTIPPLRDRSEDVPLLLDHFCDRVAERLEVTGPLFSPAAVDALRRYDWPGNVRELENLVERTAIMHPPGTLIEPEQLPARILKNQQAAPRSLPPSFEMAVDSDEDLIEEGFSLQEAVRAFEKAKIEKALQVCGDNKSQAAKKLGMKRTTLIEKLKKFER